MSEIWFHVLSCATGVVTMVSLGAGSTITGVGAMVMGGGSTVIAGGLTVSPCGLLVITGGVSVNAGTVNVFVPIFTAGGDTVSCGGVAWKGGGYIYYFVKSFDTMF